MRRLYGVCAALCAVFACSAEGQQQSPADQEALSLAVAKAYARSHLFGLGAQPFHLKADVSS